MIQRFVQASRFIVLLAVAGSFAAAVTLLVYGSILTFATVGETLAAWSVSSKGLKALVLTFIEAIDVFLLGVVFYIIALALYELFIDDTIPLPEWLVIHNLDDLKYKLVGVLIVVMGVLFLGQAMRWDGQPDLLGFGVSTALVIAALTWFLSLKGKKG
ncbi:MAG: YqhA family protein [Desulfuromonadales bacterium]|nr:MAG: YqhA family protein [Desulfuromonadales bacterium]